MVGSSEWTPPVFNSVFSGDLEKSTCTPNRIITWDHMIRSAQYAARVICRSVEEMFKVSRTQFLDFDGATICFLRVFRPRKICICFFSWLCGYVAMTNAMGIWIHWTPSHLVIGQWSVVTLYMPWLPCGPKLIAEF